MKMLLPLTPSYRNTVISPSSMETTQTDIKMDPPVETPLPDIDEMIKTARPETCESSATTIPPPSIQNKETSNDTAETPPTALLSSLLTICGATFKKDASAMAASSRILVQNHVHESIQGKENTPQAPVEQSVKKTQRRKRQAPQQQKKTKNPRLGAEVTLKKHGKAPKRKNQNPKGHKGSTKRSMQNGHVKDGGNAKFTGKIRRVVDKNASACKETVNDAAVENSRCKDSDKISASIRSAGKDTQRSVLSDKNADVTRLGPTERCQKLVGCREDDEKETNKCNATTNSGVTKNGSDKNASGEMQNGVAITCKKGDAQSLEEKYEDLSRRYTHLIRGLLQAEPGSAESSEEESDDGLSKVVDRKIYDAIYLCKIGGMLGALKIDGGPRNLVRARVEGVDNAYVQVVKDGFEFVEGLMVMDEPGEGLVIVKRVFRDLHIRLLMDVWERFHVIDGGKVLVGMVVKAMVEQMKKWYTMIVNNEMSIAWTSVITEEFVTILVRKLSNKDEKLVEEVVKTLRGVLKDISNYYQKCEAGGGSHEMFYNSCEVSVCIAAGIPDAALSLEEEDIFAIGRHNGVFARCVARLLAEREGEDGG